MLLFDGRRPPQTHLGKARLLSSLMVMGPGCVMSVLIRQPVNVGKEMVAAKEEDLLHVHSTPEQEAAERPR